MFDSIAKQTVDSKRDPNRLSVQELEVAFRQKKISPCLNGSILPVVKTPVKIPESKQFIEERLGGFFTALLEKFTPQQIQFAEKYLTHEECKTLHEVFHLKYQFGYTENLLSLISSPEFIMLGMEGRDTILKLIAKSALPVPARELQPFLQSITSMGLTPAEENKIIQAGLSLKSQVFFNRFLSFLQKPNAKELLFQKDSFDGNLLGNLQRLIKNAYEKGNSNRANSAYSASEEVIEEIITSSSSQREFSRCSQGALLYILLVTRPADYVRYLADLTSPSGQSKFPNGQSFSIVPGTDSQNVWRIGEKEVIQTERAIRDDSRGKIAKIFESALIEYENGDWSYDYVNDINRYSQSTESGTDSSWTVRGHEALLNRSYKTSYLHEAGRKAIERSLKENTKQGMPIYASLLWRDGDYHAVAVVDIVQSGTSESVVRFYNPHGPQGDAPNKILKDPPSKVVSDRPRIEEMSEPEFWSRLWSVTLPGKN